MVRIIDVVSHPDVMDDELVFRFDANERYDIRMGSQCIVRESQAAVFVRQGQALDVLGPGSHTLSTGNLPILSGLIGMLVTNGKTPFEAEVYFVNLKDMPQVRFGTNPPIQVDTPNRSPGFMLLQTFGVVDIGIEDPALFVKQYGIGKNIVRMADFSDRIQTMLLSTLGRLISAQNITGIQGANAMLNDVEAGSLTFLNEDFKAIGMRIKAFKANPFQAKDLTPQDIIKYGGDITTYERAKRLDIGQAAAENEGMGGGLASAGIGLGLGQMLGGQFGQQPQYPQQGQYPQPGQYQQPQQPPPQQAAPSNPTTKAEIQALLDNLDMRLANKEISEETYNRMVTKWEQRLKELGS